MAKYPLHLLKLIEVFKKLPGVGARSSERYVFQMLDWKSDELKEIARLIESIPTSLPYCDSCGALKDREACSFCDDRNRDSSSICIVATAREVFALEETGQFRGMYHVLGGLFSPMRGKQPNAQLLNKLKERIVTFSVKEVIIALDATLEGDATALFLKEELKNHNVAISRLAFGLPMGSSLEFVDGNTLGQAFSGRRNLN